MNEKFETRLYRSASVIDNLDEKQNGRIKIRIMPEDNGVDESLLRWVYPHGNRGGGIKGSGTHYIPEINEVIKVVILDPFWKVVEYIPEEYASDFYPYSDFTKVLSNMAELNSMSYPQPTNIKSHVDGSYSFRNSKTGETGFYHNSGNYCIFDKDGQIVIHSEKQITLDGKSDGVIDILTDKSITLDGKTNAPITIKTGKKIILDLSPTGLFSVKNSGATLHSLIKDIMSIIQNIITVGSLVAGSTPVVYSMATTDLPKIVSDLIKLDLLMED